MHDDVVGDVVYLDHYMQVLYDGRVWLCMVMYVVGDAVSTSTTNCRCCMMVGCGCGGDVVGDVVVYLDHYLQVLYDGRVWLCMVMYVVGDVVVYLDH